MSGSEPATASTAAAALSREPDRVALQLAERTEVLRRRRALGSVLGVISAVVGVFGAITFFLGFGLMLASQTVPGALTLAAGAALMLPAVIVEKWRTRVSAELRIATGGAEH